MTGSALENEKIRKRLVFTKRNWPILAVEWKMSQEIFEPVGLSEWGTRSSPKVVV